MNQKKANQITASLNPPLGFGWFTGTTTLKRDIDFYNQHKKECKKETKFI